MLAQWLEKDGFYPSMNQEEDEMRSFIFKFSKPCPRCGKPIHRSAGCSTMTCGKDGDGNEQTDLGCGFKFCWNCGRASHGGSCRKEGEEGSSSSGTNSRVFFSEMNRKIVDLGKKLTQASDTKEELVEASNSRSNYALGVRMSLLGLRGSSEHQEILLMNTKVEAYISLCSAAVLLGNENLREVKTLWYDLQTFLETIDKKKRDLEKEKQPLDDFYRSSIESLKRKSRKLVQSVEVYGYSPSLYNLPPPPFYASPFFPPQVSFYFGSEGEEETKEEEKEDDGTNPLEIKGSKGKRRAGRRSPANRRAMEAVKKQELHEVERLLASGDVDVDHRTPVCS
jgi:hypothetical protein